MDNKEFIMRFQTFWLGLVLGLCTTVTASATVYVVSATTEAALLSARTDPALQDGDVIHIPRGTYTLSTWSAVTIDHALTITGDGPGATVIDNTASTPGFLEVRHSLDIRGMTVQGFGTVFNLDNPNTTPISFAAANLHVLDSTRGFEWTSVSGDAERLVIKDCVMEDIAGPAIQLRPGSLEHAEIVGNVIDGAHNRGISLGTNTTTTTQPWKHLLVANNRVRDVRPSDPVNNTTSTQYGILVYGDEAAIQGNLIEDIYGPNDNAGDVYAGIYTKCRRCTVSGNIVRDAGPGWGITIKGSRRDNTSGTYGYGVIVANNQVYITDSPPTGLTNKVFNGIRVNNEDVTVMGNHIEGTTHDAFVVGAEAVNNVALVHNSVVNSARGIRSLGTDHTNFLVMGNRFIGVTSIYNGLDYEGICENNLPSDPTTTECAP
jgi:hypothetical protein